MALPSKFALPNRGSFAERHSASESLCFGARSSRTLHHFTKAFGILCSLVALGLLCFVMTARQVAALGLYSVGKTGVDVSWPPSNCAAQRPAGAAFGIVGVNGGRAFTRNTCLLGEAGWFASPALYMNADYAGPNYARKLHAADKPRHCAPADNRCIAYNYGFNAAEYALLYATSQNVHTTQWWLDVETANSWSADPAQNRADIQGMTDAIMRTAFLPAIGVYSTPRQWRIITDDWRSGLPNWVGTGSTHASDAAGACQGADFTGGGTVLAQYVLALDHDYVCAR